MSADGLRAIHAWLSMKCVLWHLSSLPHGLCHLYGPHDSTYSGLRLNTSAGSYYWDQNDAITVQGEMSKFRDLEYCKIDLIAAKGIVFVKYAKSSSALLALESILANDCMVSFTPDYSP